ncbi:MAG: radical SAM protein [Lachnospiraceae bacterium]|nr:radical SAM protein [Lachnospiraceae bacterium]
MDVGGNTPNGPFEEHLCKKAAAVGSPILGTFELNPTCNMNCNMCYVRMDQRQVDALGGLKSEEFWLDMAKQCMDQGLLFLLLTGGEPLLYPHFKSLLSKLQKMGLYLTLNTNGTLIDEDMARFFSEHMIRRLNITIYGKDDETYEKLCHNPKGFTQLKNAIALLNKYEVPVRLNCSITAQNYEQLDDFYRIADEWGVPIEIAYYMFPPNRKQDRGEFNKYRMTPQQTAEIGYKIQTRRFSEAEKQEFLKYQLNRIENYTNPNKFHGGFYCRSGRCNFWINWDGTLVPCGMMNGPKYNAAEEGFASCWERLKEDVSKICISEKCFSCGKNELCPHCAAGEVAECGEFGTTPSYHCETADAMVELFKRNLKE